MVNKIWLIPIVLIFLVGAFLFSMPWSMPGGSGETGAFPSPAASTNIENPQQQIILTAGGTPATPEDFFVKLVENNVGVTEDYAIYEIKNPLTKNIKINETFLSHYVLTGAGDYNIKEAKVELWDTWETTIIEGNWTHECDKSTPPKCNSTRHKDVEVAYNVTGWRELKNIKELQKVPGDSFLVKYTVKHDPRYGKLSNVDWVPQLKVDEVTYKNVKWAWWNGSWGMRQAINITNNNPTYNLPTNYTINMTYNTTGADKLDSGDDIRIVCGDTEKDRFSDVWDNEYSNITWKLPMNVSADSFNDTYCYVYYDNSGAGTPPTDMTNIADFYDDFTRGDSGTIGNGWTEYNAANAEIYNNQVRQQSATRTWLYHPVSYLVDDIYGADVRAMINIETDYQGGIQWAVNEGDDTGYLLYGDERDTQDVKAYRCEDISTASCTPIGSTGDDIPQNTWFELRGRINIATDVDAWLNGASIAVGITDAETNLNTAPNVGIDLLGDGTHWVYGDNFTSYIVFTTPTVTFNTSESGGTAASVSINTPTAYYNYSTYPLLNSTITNGVTCQFSLNGVANQSLPNCDNPAHTLSNSTIGANSVTVWVNDGSVWVTDTIIYSFNNASIASWFTTPTPPNNTITNNTNFVFGNLTAEENLTAAYFEFGGTNYSMASYNSTQWYYNKTGISGGTYWYRGWVNTSFGIWNASKYRRWVLDLTPAPDVTLHAPTNTSYNTNLTWINYTVINYYAGTVPCWHIVDTTIYSDGDLSNNTYENNTHTLSPGAHNASAVCEQNSTNITSSEVWFTVYNGVNSPTLSASPGWSIIEGSSVSISCSAVEGTATLQFGGSNVSNPYVASPSVGSYSFTCLTPTGNYSGSSTSNTLNVVSSNLGCTDSDTFAFSKDVTVNASADNFTTFQLDSFVSQGLVTPQLTDLEASGDADIYVNFTGGYYAIVNGTGLTNFTFYWGNWLNNASRSTRQLSTITDNLSIYTTLNPYYIINILEEMTGNQALPPNATTTVQIICSNGSTTFTAYNTNQTVATFVRPDLIRSVVYVDSEQFERSLLVRADAETKNIYMTDANSYTVLQIPIEITDFDYWNAAVTLYKLGQGQTTITENYLDVEHKFDTYLIKDEIYYIRLTTNSEIRDIGYLYPAAAGIQEISIVPVQLRPTAQLAGNNILLFTTCNNVTNALQFMYNDLLNETNSVRIRIYNQTNQTAWYDNTVSNSSNFTTSLNNVNCNVRHGIRLTIYHDTFGNSPVEHTIGAGLFGIAASLGSALPSWIYNGITFVLVFMTALVSVPRIRLAALVMMGTIIAILAFYGWYVPAAGLAGLIVVFLVVSIIYEIKRGQMS